MIDLELFRTIVSIAFIGVFAFWIRRDEERKKTFNPGNWLGHVKNAWGQAKQMSRGEWFKFLAVSLSCTLVALMVVPAIPSLLESHDAQVSNEEHPVNQISETGDKPIYGFFILMGAMTLLPILEEWLFRRKMLEYIKNQDFKFSTVSAVFVSAGSFGFFHLLNSGTYIYAALPPFFGGLIFGVAYLLQGFKASCFTHIFYNELILIMMYAAVYF